MFRSRLLAASTVLAAALAAAAFITPVSAFQTASPAASQDAVRVELDGMVVRDGKAVPTDGLEVQPGEEITWTVRVLNRARDGVSNVRAEGLIPKGTRFVPGSAVGAGVTVQYSIDGGRNFSPRPVVVVEGRERLASPDAYTNVLFTWHTEVPPGGAAAAKYRTRIL